MQIIEHYEQILTILATWGTVLFTFIQISGYRDRIATSKFGKIYTAFETITQITYNEKTRQEKLLNGGKLTDEQRVENMEHTLKETGKYIETAFPSLMPMYNVLTDYEKIAMVEKILRDFKKNPVTK